MAKYIVNIILVTACLFTYTSCIRKMNLYDENRNTGQDNNEKDTDSTPVYMYPFDKETANVTAEIIIHTKKEIQTKDINVEIPHLKDMDVDANTRRLHAGCFLPYVGCNKR